MISALRPYQLYALLTLAIGLNFYLIANELYFALAYPLALLTIIAALYAPDKVFLFIVFCTPLSLNLIEFEVVKAGFYFPTEPLLFGIMVLYLMRVLAGDSIDKRFMRHPITIAILVYLVWILITALTSSMFLVSLKFFVVKLWFVVSCYFFGKEIFRDYKNIKRFVWLYIIPLTGVILYTVIRHSTHGFNLETAYWVMGPFFKDHTSYGALLAMFFPLLVGFMVQTKYNGLIRSAILLVIVVFAIGIILSYTRAAWVSLAGAFAVFLVMKLRIDFKLLVIFGLASAGLFTLNYDRIMMQLDKNYQGRSDDIGEHVQSIFNISSDASNLERLLRWNCAIRMFKDRPVFGFGPGTYQFQYATYQFSGERTIISTNFGDGGNAHSEYLGPLAESGLLGMLTFGFLVTIVLYRGIRLYYEIDDPEVKILLMGILLGLITYLIHGVLNNYLDTDKASVPFFGFIAIIVAIDLYHGPQSRSRFEEKSATQ